MLILASGSPRRRELLDQIGVSYKVIVSDVKEIKTARTSAELVTANAAAKAEAVAAKYPQDVVLGADTVVTWQGKVFGKLRDAADAERMLKELQGHSHEVITGMALILKGKPYTTAVSTIVTFAPMTASQIQAYVATGEPLDKAGAYAVPVQGGGPPPTLSA
jgi:septum formation protein